MSTEHKHRTDGILLALDLSLTLLQLLQLLLIGALRARKLVQYSIAARILIGKHLALSNRQRLHVTARLHTSRAVSRSSASSDL
jgi:hypothetical protein